MKHNLEVGSFALKWRRPLRLLESYSLPRGQSLVSCTSAYRKAQRKAFVL